MTLRETRVFLPTLRETLEGEKTGDIKAKNEPHIAPTTPLTSAKNGITKPIITKRARHIVREISIHGMRKR